MLPRNLTRFRSLLQIVLHLGVRPSWRPTVAGGGCGDFGLALQVIGGVVVAELAMMH